MPEAVQRWKEAHEYQDEEYRRAYGPRVVRYLCCEDWAQNMGHIAHLDIFAKAARLGKLDYPHIVLADDDKIHNPSMFDCFRSHFEVKPRGNSADVVLSKVPCAVIKLDGSWIWFIDAANIVERAWGNQGPLCTLSSERVEYGREKLGLKDGDWFVAFHAREYRDGQSGRDGNRGSFNMSMVEVMRSGGKPVMMPTGDRVLDTFLTAKAKFVVSSNSGPAWMAGVFGTPVLGVDWHPVGIELPYKGSMTIPKKIRHKGSQDTLPLSQMTKTPLNHMLDEQALATLGWELVPNTPDEVLGGVRQMIERMGS